MQRLLSVLFLILLLLPAGCVSSGRAASGSQPGADVPAEASAYADFMVARIASVMNDPVTAAERFGAVLGSLPDPAPVAERAVFSALLAGNFLQAERLAEEAVKAGSEAGLVSLTLATGALRRGDGEGAREWLQPGGYHPFNRSLASGLQAWLALDIDGLEAAEAVIGQALTGDAALDSPSLYHLALLQMSAGEEEAALATFDAVWASGAKLAIGAEAYAHLLASRGEASAALEIIDNFLGEVGNNAGLARLATRIRAGERLAPPRLDTRQGGAIAIYVPAAGLLYQTNDDLAAVYLTLVLALDPEFDVARPLMAEAMEKAGRYEDAVQILAGVPETSPYYANARGQLAGILLETGRSEEALAVAGEALRAHPDRGLRLQLADLYVTMEDYRQAEAVLAGIRDEDLARGREDWRVIFGLGAARERLGRWEEAEADLVQALSLRPENPTLLNYLGYSWVDRGVRLEEGLDLIRRAVILSPRSGHFVDSLGWAYYRLGETEKAIDYLERAVELLPSDPVLNDHLGDAYWRAGRRVEAVYQWRRALRLDPGEKEGERIGLKIENGPGQERQGDPVTPARPAG